MANDTHEMAALIAGALQGTLNEEQLRLLNDWRQAAPENQQLFDQLTSKEKLAPRLAVLHEYEQDAVRNKLSHRIVPRSKFRYLMVKNWLQYAAAASILLMIAVGFWWMQIKKQPPVTQQASRFKNDVAPGGDKAVLVLGDGSTIYLDQAQDGSLVQQGGMKIVKQGGTLTYERANTHPQSADITYNTLTTPKGGQYQVTLPDHSRVWLNAASSIRYATAFTGNERRVEITGEAYFEVAKEKNKPFRVAIAPVARGASPVIVEVLGTEFNVNAYSNEAAVKTTLLEGKVKVLSGSQSSTIVPGQQAQLIKGIVQVVDHADLEEAMAWKNNTFVFNNLTIEDIMRQLSRWYDVEVVYEQPVNTHFIASIPRTVTLSKVLQVLELTGGVRFEIDGKKITVKK